MADGTGIDDALAQNAARRGLRAVVMTPWLDVGGERVSRPPGML